MLSACAAGKIEGGYTKDGQKGYKNQQILVFKKVNIKDDSDSSWNGVIVWDRVQKKQR